jgi:hypothetical protein
LDEREAVTNNDLPGETDDGHDVYEEDVLEEEGEDQHAFLSEQFQCDYNRLKVDRLERLNKADLMEEFLLLEKTVEELEGRLSAIAAREEAKARSGEADYEFARGEVPMEPEVAAKIRIFQEEISRLGVENSRLAAENAELTRRQLLAANVSESEEEEDLGDSSSSSSSSSSASSSSSSSSDSDSSCEEEEELVTELLEGRIKAEESKTEDTGYESAQSKEQTPEREIQSAALADYRRCLAANR